MRLLCAVAGGLVVGLLLGSRLFTRPPAPVKAHGDRPRIITVPTAGTADSSAELARLAAELAALRRAVEALPASSAPAPTRAVVEPPSPSPAVDQAEASGRALLDSVLAARTLDRDRAMQLHALLPQMSDGTRHELLSRMTTAINEGRLRPDFLSTPNNEGSVR
jgi:hypothetical protein